MELRFTALESDKTMVMCGILSTNERHAVLQTPVARSSRWRRPDMPTVPQCGVYAIRCIPLQRVYVGSSLSLSRRLASHRNALRRGDHFNKALQSAWNEHGESAFEFVCLETTSSNERHTRETYWIEQLAASVPARGFNRHSRGAGHPISADVKAKLSAVNTGKELTPDHRARIAEASVRRGISPETRAKMVAARKANGGYGSDIMSRIRKGRS